MSQVVVQRAPDGVEGGLSDIRELRPRGPAPGESHLDELAERINALSSARSLQQVLALGEVVHRALRSGDVRAPGANAADRRASLRRIAAHPSVPFKVTTIWRAVSVYELSLRLPHLLGAPGLGVSHLRAVIGLDLADQEALLTAASKERWTKRRLEEAAAARRRLEEKKRGRRPLSPALMLTRDAERFIERADAVLAEGEGVVELGETFERLLTQVEERSARLRALASR